MGALRDMLRLFKRGPTQSGFWGDRELFGRLQGTGEAIGEVTPPQGEDFVISVEDYRMIDELDVELTGPDGSPVALDRDRQMSKSGSRNAVHNLHRLAHGTSAQAGIHRLSVRAPDPAQPLIVVVGKDSGIG